MTIDMIKDNFASKINEFIEKNSLSNVAFGNIFSVTETTVRRWRSKQSVPSIEAMLNIANHLKITLNELLGIDSSLSNDELKILNKYSNDPVFKNLVDQLINYK